ncbi:aldose epimerase family protein [Caulobacter sp. RL271]|jgi:aldose 1-epimerase|uniref:Aldose 1-epimerase n=1 Tax=Caulobacter segnis TaxID=88688 RepID=A0ABY4ZUE7_9CAUL|nr:aldose epimerase family protein [Caulobacter segnis]USQ96290.1 galactose mutarotase [Caulobacter segnis]
MKAVFLMVVGLGLASSALAAEARRETFGQIDGRPVPAVVLTNAGGVKARIIAYGAALQALETPDRDGQVADIVLGYDDVAQYVANPSYLGVTLGRYANRIAKAGFTLDGQRYALAATNGPNTLHGGQVGFGRVLWAIAELKSGDEASVTLTHVSPDGDEGFPGALSVSVTYALNDRNELAIRYSATTTRPTVVNLSNHSYFNLAGAGSGRTILDDRLTLAAERYTPVDATGIPTGELAPVAGGPFDFKAARVIGQAYDHNFVLDGTVTAEPRAVARLEDPRSGRAVQLLTTEPGLQVYTGAWLKGAGRGKGGHAYGAYEGVALEPQHFPDSPNQPAFPSVRLEPGQTYRQTSIFRLSADAAP